MVGGGWAEGGKKSAVNVGEPPGGTNVGLTRKWSVAESSAEIMLIL
jgi:hypothetical protein